MKRGMGMLRKAIMTKALYLAITLTMLLALAVPALSNALPSVFMNVTVNKQLVGSEENAKLFYFHLLINDNSGGYSFIIFDVDYNYIGVTTYIESASILAVSVDVSITLKFIPTEDINNLKVFEIPDETSNYTMTQYNNNQADIYMVNTYNDPGNGNEVNPTPTPTPTPTKPH